MELMLDHLLSAVDKSIWNDGKKHELSTDQIGQRISMGVSPPLKQYFSVCGQFISREFQIGSTQEFIKTGITDIYRTGSHCKTLQVHSTTIRSSSAYINVQNH